MSLRFHRSAPMQVIVSTLLVVLAGTAEAATTLTNENTKAGKILAIILGTVVGGLALLFLLFGLWLWGRIKKNRRLEEEAARAQEEGRTSADTIVEGAHYELQETRQQEHGKDNGI